MMGQWFSSASPHIVCQSRDRRAERSCTPPALAPGSASGLCGISGGYSRCRRLWIAWCRPQHIRTAGSHISRTGHSPELPLDIGFGHPQKQKRLEVKKKTMSIHTGYKVPNFERAMNGAVPAMIEAMRDISMFLTKFNFSSSYGDTSYSSYATTKVEMFVRFCNSEYIQHKHTHTSLNS